MVGRPRLEAGRAGGRGLDDGRRGRRGFDLRGGAEAREGDGAGDDPGDGSVVDRAGGGDGVAEGVEGGAEDVDHGVAAPAPLGERVALTAKTLQVAILDRFALTHPQKVRFEPGDALRQGVVLGAEVDERGPLPGGDGAALAAGDRSARRFRADVIVGVAVGVERSTGPGGPTADARGRGGGDRARREGDDGRRGTRSVGGGLAAGRRRGSPRRRGTTPRAGEDGALLRLVRSGAGAAVSRGLAGEPGAKVAFAVGAARWVAVRGRVTSVIPSAVGRVAKTPAKILARRTTGRWVVRPTPLPEQLDASGSQFGGVPLKGRGTRGTVEGALRIGCLGI